MTFNYGDMAEQLEREAAAMRISFQECPAEQLLALRQFTIYQGYQRMVEQGNRLGIIDQLLKQKGIEVAQLNQ